MRKVLPFFIFLFISLLVFVARIPVMLAPPWDIDEGIYAVVGQQILRGALLYKDVWDNKTPGIYFLFDFIQRLNPSFVSFRVAATISLLLAGGLVFYLALRSGSKASAYLALGMFSLLCIIPVFQTNTSNAEVFFLPLSTAAILLTYLIEFNDWSRWNYLLVGGVLCLGVLFKILVILDILALGIFLLLKYRRSVLRPLGLMLVGALAVAVIPAVYMLTNGLTGDFINAAILGNFGYIGQESQGGGFWFIRDPRVLLMIKGVLLLAATVILAWYYRRKVTLNTLLCLWFFWTLAGALMSGRPFLHYLIASMAALVLLSSAWLTRIWTGRGILSLREWTGSLTMAVAFILIVVVGFANGQLALANSSPELTRLATGYFTNSYSFLAGVTSKQDYYSFYGPVPDLNLKLSRYIADHTHQNDRVFIYGSENAPWVYYLSNRRPATKYVAAYHIVQDKGGAADTLSELLANPPVIIAITNEPDYIAQAGSPTPDFPGFTELLRTYYRYQTSIGTADIYVRYSLADAGTP